MSQEAPGTEPAGVAAKSAATGRWPLVGRDDELGSVCRAMRQGVSPVVVTGEPGIGKTRLAREALRALVTDGVEGVWATAGAGARSISLGALAPWLGGPAGAGVASPAETGAALRAALEDRYDGRRLVLVVDDAQWLDEASASVVAELAHSGQPQLLLTVRSDEALSPPLATLLAEARASTVRLTPLDEGDVRRLVPEILTGPLDPSFVHRLWRRSEGNPLWLRELVLDALASGRLARADGQWRWDDGGGAPGPRLIDLLRDRLAVGDPEMARWLDLIALSEPLPLGLAEAAIGRDGIDGLVDIGLVDIGSAGTDQSLAAGSVRLSHPLFGELLRAVVPPLRARSLWRTLVRSAEEDPDPAVAIRRLAAWRLEADLPVPPAMGACAAEDALDYGDPELAERLARAGIAGVADGPVEPGVRENLAVALVEALAWLGQWDQVLQEIGDLESASLDGNQQARLAAVRLWPHLFLGDLVAADRFLADAAAEATTPQLRDAATTHRASVALFRGDVEACHDIAWELLDRPELDDFSRRWSIRAVVNADALRGAGSLAISTAEAELARPGGGLDLTLAPVELVVGYCLGLWRSGRLRSALEVAEAYHEGLKGSRDPHRAAVGLMLTGIGRLELGLVAQAESRLSEACDVMGRDQPLFFLPFAFAELARARALLGQADGTGRVLDAVGEAFLKPLPVFASALRRSRAWHLVALGRADEGVRLLLDGLAGLGAQGQLAQQAVLAHDVVRMGRPEVIGSMLDELAPACDGVLVEHYAAHARAATAGDVDSLEELALALAALGDGLLAAELWAEAAVLHRAGGRHVRAAGCTDRARSCLEPCGPVHSPALDRLTWRRRQLTPREAELAVLARQGLTNREIAARTGCTVRTVENHLGRVYLKLGVAGRRELPTVLP